MMAFCDVVRRAEGAATRCVSLAACAVALGSAGCVASRGSFETTGYRSDYGYDVAYVPGTRSLLPGAWGLDNFRLDRGGQWVHKDNGRYRARFAFDHDGDGVADDELTTYTYALRYEHRVRAGVIWLREIPISAKLRHKELRVLMQDYVDQIAGATYETVQLGTVQPLSRTRPQQVVVEQREAAEIVEDGPASVAGLPAWAATIELANIDQIKLVPGARGQRIQLVFLRAPKDEVFEDVARKRKLAAPVLLVAGYSNYPADFASELRDFHDFLGRLRVDGRSGLMLQLAARQPAPGASAKDPLPAAPSGSAPATPPASSEAPVAPGAVPAASVPAPAARR
ncbi:MAG TPA: hypothetical protein VHN14_14785 [Kofleriaceae bacterium]|jgi:hypothetical protein|nr:hypothetical protein [Kofleriaceae bacterium]